MIGTAWCVVHVVLEFLEHTHHTHFCNNQLCSRHIDATIEDTNKEEDNDKKDSNSSVNTNNNNADNNSNVNNNSKKDEQNVHAAENNDNQQGHEAADTNTNNNNNKNNSSNNNNNNTNSNTKKDGSSSPSKPAQANMLLHGNYHVHALTRTLTLACTRICTCTRAHAQSLLCRLVGFQFSSCQRKWNPPNRMPQQLRSSRSGQRARVLQSC